MNIVQRWWLRRHGRQFTNREKRRAEEALRLYEEVFQRHLRWEFNGRPGQIPPLLNRREAHHSDLSLLQKHTNDLAVFVRLLQKLSGRHIRHARPALNSKVPGPHIDRSLNDAEVNTYALLHQALTAYISVLAWHGATSVESSNALCRVASIINPDEWRATGFPVPEGVVAAKDLEAVHFLNDVETYG